VDKIDTESVKQPRRRVAYVCGRWRVTYLCFGENGRETGVRHGLIVGPLVPDLFTTLWIAVLPDGSRQHTMVRRDSITNITPPRHGR
jgi:hypothetical protein